MSAQAEPHTLRKGWNKHVQPSLLDVISLTQFAAAYIREWGADSVDPRLRQTTELPHLTATVVLDE